MRLRRSYTVFAPIYDAAVERATRRARRQALAALDLEAGHRCLLPGIGTGLDLPFLPPGPDYVGLDLNRAMLRRCRQRADALDGSIELIEGDAMTLPLAAETFDAVVLHLILAVVPQPSRVMDEAARVLRPGGTLLIFDKFLRPGQWAPLRRALTPLSGRLATRLDVTLEPLLAAHPELELTEDEPALGGGWFRRLRLVRR